MVGAGGAWSRLRFRWAWRVGEDEGVRCSGAAAAEEGLVFETQRLPLVRRAVKGGGGGGGGGRG